MKHLLKILGTALSLMTTHSKADDDTRLWYDKPGELWYQESLPIGNGYMGALILGQTRIERIPLNEETTWAGGPGESPTYNGGNRPDAHEALAPVRDLLRNGKTEEAHKLMTQRLLGIVGKKPKRDDSISTNKPVVRNPPDGKIQFPGFGNNQTTVDLVVETPDTGGLSAYRRSLDLRQALATVDYTSGDVHHSRTAFASYPDRAMVFRFENDHPGGLNYSVWMETFHKVERVDFNDGIYTFDAILANNGMKFQAIARIDAPGAVSINFHNGRITISGANRVDVSLTIASNYLNEHPKYTGGDPKALNATRLATISIKGYDRLLAEHLADYQTLFNRVELSLGESGNTALPTDERLLKYSKGTKDAGLESLYFQFGRYLLISSSRNGTLPAHLQGKWNVEMDPQWACDYHTNINLQMNYWPAEVANLSETHGALIDYIVSLQKPGRQSAKDFFNARGWIVNTMNNIFGYTAVNWGDWGYFPAGAGWLCRHLWEYYEFTQDKEFLKQTAYPVMKDAALFWLDYLVEDENGKLVSMPSFSPEHGGISTGTSMDQQIVQDLFGNLLSAAKLLGEEDKAIKQVRIAREKLLGPKVGRHGQLQEWKEDRDDPNDQHRHISHLYALYPGNQISLSQTPELAAAARQSLTFRGDAGTGWSMAWKTNFWARLQDGEHAYLCLKTLLTPCSNHNHGGMKLPGGTYPNLFCAHPPFQIDGNLGGTAGIAEMLIQSHADRIHLLPAIPAAWKDGSVKGLKARGGFEIGMQWADGRVQTVSIKSLAGNPCRLLVSNPLYLNQLSTVKVPQGWVAEFDTEAGQTYQFKAVP
ncbi:MAG: glycoside hydrolase N-terminal domain-containing protein [Akkermansiaceae bacterium]